MPSTIDKTILNSAAIQKNKRKRANNDDDDDDDKVGYGGDGELDDLSYKFSKLVDDFLLTQNHDKPSKRNEPNVAAAAATTEDCKNNESEFEMMDLLDCSFVDLADLKEDTVLIKLPTFYFNADSSSLKNYAVSEWRAIKLDDLSRCMEVAMQIEQTMPHEQNAISRKIITLMMESNPKMLEIIEPTLRDSVESVQRLSLLDVFNPTTVAPINFDCIREYDCDENNFLVSYSNATYEKKPFYSLFEASEIAAIRKTFRDTDYNRFQYIIEQFTETVLYRPHRSYFHFNSVLNVLLLFMWLTLSSSPVQGHSRNDSFFHYLAVSYYSMIESKPITAWQKSEHFKHELYYIRKTMTQSLFQIMASESPEERAKLAIRLLDNSKSAAECFDYDRYKTLRAGITFENKDMGCNFLRLDVTFIEKLVNNDSINHLLNFKKQFTAKETQIKHAKQPKHE